MTRLLVCGAINWDTICLVEHLPAPGEEVTCARVSEVPGGTVANVAVAAARLLGPDAVALFGGLGNDKTALTQTDILQSEGVVCNAIVRINEQPSGHAYILVDQSGQNVIATNLGANEALTVGHTRKARLTALLQDCRCVALTDTPLAVAAHLIGMAAGHGIPVLWDPGVLVHHGWPGIGPLMKDVHSLVLNEAEVASLFGTVRPLELRRLLADGPEHLILKRGEYGALTVPAGDGRPFRIPALPLAELGMTAVNAVGCGDVFLGTYAAGLSNSTGLKPALLEASIAAGYNAARAETRGAPDQTTLQALMEKARALGFETEELENNDE